MSTIEIGSFEKRVLLVGAGFSKNWGGRLASEVWADVFSNSAVQRQEHVRQAMLRERSFEAVLEEVLTGAYYNSDDQRAIIEAITQTFERMDELYRKTIISKDKLINYATLQFVFRRFKQTAGYFFTLNQDRLLELILDNRAISYQIPHVPQIAQIRIPNERPSSLPNTYSTSLNLIKLHGCYTWTNSEGAPVMVVGKEKEKKIAGSWLLTEYQKVFDSVLNSGSVRLLIIGYSFRDTHINKIIGRAVSQHQCKVFVWDPMHPLDTLNENSGEENRAAILGGLTGWEPRSIQEVMPAVRVIQIADEDVLRAFFH